MSKQCNKNKKAHLYASGGMDIGGMALGTMQFADGLMSYKKEREANEELYNNAIDNARIGFNGLSSINNLDDLESQLSNYNKLHEIGTSDLIGNDANRLGKYLSVSSQAAQAGGASGNAFGFLAGSIVGQLGAGWMSKRNKKKAEEAVDDINQRVRDTNELYASMTNNRLNNIMQNQMSENQWNYIAALGGNLHSNSTTWDNGLNYIGAGGSHESNPNDGVAISTAPDGLENKVEEGEVVWDNEYVFSKRLTIPEKDKKANKWKGKTYADVAKKLMEDSEERPNDPITLRGLDDSLSRLRDSQDELKAKQEERKIKKEIASMPPEMLAQLQQQAQQPTEEEMAQQVAMEQQQMPMVDPSMPQPIMEQPPMYAKGGNVKAVSGKGFFTPLPSPQIERIDYQSIPSASEVNAVKNAALTDYINKQSEYVNVKDAQKYGGFYNNVDKVNEYLNGNTPMSTKNAAQGVANQQSFESGKVYTERLPVKKNYGIDENDAILDRDNKASVDFFLKNNPNLNLDSDTIYFYSKDKNDEANKNKFLKANKVNKEVYDKNSVENISKISGINFDRSHAKGGHLFFGGSNMYTWGDTDPKISAAENYLATHSQKPIVQTQKGPVVQDDLFGRPTDNQVSTTSTSTPSGNGINKGAMFQGIAQGIDMIGAGFQSAGYKGGDLNALYKGTKHKDMFGKGVHTAMNMYKNIGLIGSDSDDGFSLFAKGGHLHANDPDVITNEVDLLDYLNRVYKINEPLKKEDISLDDITGSRRASNAGRTLQLLSDARKLKMAENAAERKEKIKNAKNKTKSALSNLDETSLRYAPVWGSIFNLARSIASRPDYGNPERIERAAAQVGAPVSPKYIGDYLQYRPLDESYYLNQLNAQQNAINNNIIGLSNGNRSMALASMLANDYNYNTQRGNAYRQGLEYNDVNRLRFGEFNRGTNQFNAQQHLSAAAQNAQNRANAANLIASAAQMREGIDNAYGASQSANWTNLFNNLGAVGKDRMNWNMAKDIYDYQTGRNGEVKFKGNNASRGGYLTIKTKNRRKE